MQINVKLKIKDVTGFQSENKEHFEYDLRESVRELLICLLYTSPSPRD